MTVTWPSHGRHMTVTWPSHGRYIAAQAPVMFCTDVAARGLHVEAVSLVVNYDMPQVL